VTDYGRRSFDDALRFCIGLGDRCGKPVLRDLAVERGFWAYLQADPRGLLPNEDVWIAAQSQPISAGTKWTWLGDGSTSK